jgi:hypothetical protein
MFECSFIIGLRFTKPRWSGATDAQITMPTAQRLVWKETSAAGVERGVVDDLLDNGECAELTTEYLGTARSASNTKSYAPLWIVRMTRRLLGHDEYTPFELHMMNAFRGTLADLHLSPMLLPFLGGKVSLSSNIRLVRLKERILAAVRRELELDDVYIDHMVFQARTAHFSPEDIGKLTMGVHADNCNPILPRILPEDWETSGLIRRCVFSADACCSWRSHTAVLYLTSQGGGDLVLATDAVALRAPIQFGGVSSRHAGADSLSRLSRLFASTMEPGPPEALAESHGIHRNGPSGARIEPRCGRLALFTSGVENPHLVTPLTGGGGLNGTGDRAALVLWFTRERAWGKDLLTLSGAPLWLQLLLGYAPLFFCVAALVAVCQGRLRSRGPALLALVVVALSVHPGTIMVFLHQVLHGLGY